MTMFRWNEVIQDIIDERQGKPITNFAPGEKIIFAGQEYTVLQNYGRSGKVYEGDDPTAIIDNFYWTFEGETAERV